MTRPGLRGLLLACALLGALASHAQQPPKRELPGARVNESTGVTLKLLDVNVLDPAGQPIRGLVADDFQIELNTRRRSIYSVEDLCDATDTDPRGVVPTYLYLDLPQILPGRLIDSLPELHRLLKELPKDTGKIELIVNSGRGRLQREIIGRDVDAFDRVLDQVGPDLVSPFMYQLIDQLDQCAEERTPRCLDYTTEFRSHLQHSHVALARVISGLATVPGHKRFFYVHQTMTTQPSAVVGVADPQEDEIRRRMTGERQSTNNGFYLLDRLLREITGTAVTHQVAMYPVLLSRGDATLDLARLGRQARNFSARIADATGGAYNLELSTLGGLIETASQDTRCIYRIAVRLPQTDQSKIYNAQISVRGRTLPFRFTLEYLDEADAWMRRAQATLLDPANASEQLYARIVPLSREGNKWTVRLAASLDVSAIFSIPRQQREVRAWEFGAILYEVSTGKSWDFLDEAETVYDPEEGASNVLYTREMKRLKPGVYDLRVFVRDKYGNTYWGGSDELSLPESDEPFAGPPIVETMHDQVFVLKMPTIRRKSKPTAQKIRREKDYVPFDPAHLSRQIRVSQLVCGEAEEGSWQLNGPSGVVRPAESRSANRGDCRVMHDHYLLPSGDYRYESADPEIVANAWTIRTLEE